MKEEANVTTTIGQQIRQCVQRNPGCYSHQIVVAVRTLSGRDTFSHAYISKGIESEVREARIFILNGQYYTGLKFLDHEELLSLACNNRTPKELKRLAFKGVIERMSRTD